MLVTAESKRDDFIKVLQHIESMARSVALQRKVTDPTARKHFDLFLKRRVEVED